MARECAICGKPAFRYYSKCLDCIKLDKEKKEIELINQKANTTKINKENICQKCGKHSGQYEVCYDCFRESLKKDNELLIESEKDSGIDTRMKWPPKIRTKQGVKVRSHAECRIADWLTSHGIVFTYEEKILSRNDVNKYLLTDFYIPDAKVYIEYWGYKDKETYNKRRKEKKLIYDENNLTMLDLEDNHLEVLDDAMKQLLHPHLPDKLKDNLYK